MGEYPPGRSKVWAGGYVSLHRTLLDNPRARDPDWVAVWVFLLLKANYTRQDVLFQGEHHRLGPGMLVTNRREISERTGVHESKVKRVLELMKTDQQIDQQGESKGSMITILNWRLYQKVTSKMDSE